MKWEKRKKTCEDGGMTVVSTEIGVMGITGMMGGEGGVACACWRSWRLDRQHGGRRQN